MSVIINALKFITRQQRPFKVNIVKNMLQNFSLGLTQQYQSIFVIALGATALELGYVTSLGGVATMLLSIPSGLLADRQGIKKMMMASLLLFTLGYSIFGLALNWQLTALAYICIAIAILVANNVCPMVCGSCLNSVERTTGMQLCDTVAAIPRLFAPVGAAILIAYFGGLTTQGIRPLFWLAAILLLFTTLFMFKFFENPIIPTIPEGQGITGGLRRVFQEGVKVRRWLAYYMLSSIPWYMSFYIPLYAREIKNVGPLTLGLMDSGYWLMVVLLAIPVGLASDRIGRKKIILVLTPVYCLGLFALGNASSEVVIVLAGALCGFTMLSGVTESSMTVELVPRDLLGSWFGVLGFFMGLISFVGPIIGGFIWGIEPIYILYFLAATQLAKLVILGTMPSKTKYS
ncbi:MAG: MFS transporter [Candidatus Bathyarchaeia archaeon]